MKIADIELQDLNLKVEFFNNDNTLRFLKEYNLNIFIDALETGADSFNLDLNYNTQEEAINVYNHITDNIKKFEESQNV